MDNDQDCKIHDLTQRGNNVHARIVSDDALVALQGCLELPEFCDVVAMQAVMNSLPINPEDFYSSSTTFSERCLEHFCRIYHAPPKRSALALCRLMACQEFDCTPRSAYSLVDASSALRPYLQRHERESRASFELTQLRRSTHLPQSA